jgi:hypothetical protein
MGGSNRWEAKSPVSFKNETVNVFCVLASPVRVFGDVGRESRWRAPLIFAITSSLVIGWFMVPALEEPMKKIYARSFGAGSAESVMATVMRSLLMVEMVVEPFLRIVRWMVVASALYVLCFILLEHRRPSFAQCFSIAAYSEAILVLASALDLFIIYARGLNQVESSGDLRFLTRGLEFVIAPGGSNQVLATLLSSVTLPSILYVLYVSIGTGVVAGLKRSTSIGIGGLTWLFWLTVCAARPVMEKAFFNMIG